MGNLKRHIWSVPYWWQVPAVRLDSSTVATDDPLVTLTALHGSFR